MRSSWEKARLYVYAALLIAITVAIVALAAFSLGWQNPH